MSISPYTTDLDRIHDTLMNGDSDDVMLIGNAVTALTSIVQSQQKTIEQQQEIIKNLSDSVSALWLLKKPE